MNKGGNTKAWPSSFDRTEALSFWMRTAYADSVTVKPEGGTAAVTGKNQVNSVEKRRTICSYMTNWLPEA